MRAARWLATGLIFFIGCGGPERPVAALREAPLPCTEEWIHMPMLFPFWFGSSDVSPEFRPILVEVVRDLRRRTGVRRIRLEGHSDPCGNERNDFALSEARAESVANELVRMGVPRRLIVKQAFGDTQPRVQPDDCPRWILREPPNKRVEFMLLACRPDG